MSGITHRVPVTTVGGFLGAGKTTLVNHLLKHAGGRRVAVFVNDFGAIDIDVDTIDTVEENRVSLKNGCVCCTLNADLVAGIARFARAARPPDAIVIEASGVSDPRALDASMSALEGAGLTRLDLRLYLVDAFHYGALGYADIESLLDHAATSDVVLVNKTDLATDSARRALLADLADAAPFTVILETRRGAVDPSLLTSPSLSRRPATQRRDAGPFKDRSHRFRTWSFETRRRFRRDRFVALLGDLAKYCVRAKGFIRFAGAPPTMHLFNMVGSRADIEACTRAPCETGSRLVFIGSADRFDESHVEALVRYALSDRQ